MRVWEREKVNSCFYFRAKKIWQNEGGGHSTLDSLLEDVVNPLSLCGTSGYSCADTPSLRMRMAELRHRRFNYSYSASSNTWECSQCRGRQRTRCALLVRSYHHHTPSHLRHLPAVSQSDNSRGYPSGYCYRETWGCPSEVNFGRVFNGFTL